MQEQAAIIEVANFADQPFPEEVQPVAFPSFMSVFIEAIRPTHSDANKDIVIIQGSGFVLGHRGEDFLITNGHIVTGRTRKTNEPLGASALPKRLRVVIPMVGRGLGAVQGAEGLAILGTRTMSVDLYDEVGQPLWFMHPTFGRQVDVVALPLQDQSTESPDLSGVYLPYRLSGKESAPKLEPPDEVSIVGFPYGLRGGASTAIWIRGTVATEPDYLYEGESCFLVDARTRDGQSGSPVIQYPGIESDQDLDWHLLGVYSSRVADPSGPHSSDLGRVWTASALKSVVEGEQLGDLTYE